MTKNSIVHELDFKYKNYLKVVCKQVLLNSKGLPLTWEDLYNNFLYEAPRILESYDDSQDISLKTYLGLSCKFYCQNYCREFQTNKHKVLNLSINMEPERISRLEDTLPLPEMIDTSIFSGMEMKVFKNVYLDGLSLKKTSKKINISIYKLRTITNNIKVKLLMTYKN